MDRLYGHHHTILPAKAKVPPDGSYLHLFYAVLFHTSTLRDLYNVDGLFLFKKRLVRIE